VGGGGAPGTTWPCHPPRRAPPSAACGDWGDVGDGWVRAVGERVHGQWGCGSRLGMGTNSIPPAPNHSPAPCARPTARTLSPAVPQRRDMPARAAPPPLTAHGAPAKVLPRVPGRLKKRAPSPQVDWGDELESGGGVGRQSVGTGPGAHLTMKALSLSICSSETSRSAVEGTPSSSICNPG
jgi:hypothetical protein